MFNINGYEWGIKIVPPRNPHLMRSNGTLALGMCDNVDKIIYINWNLSQDMFHKVLCHEVVHAAMFSYNVNLTIEQEEIVADIIATYGEEIINITNSLFYEMKYLKHKAS